MQKNAQTKVHNLSDDQFAQAIKKATGIKREKADTLVTMYRNMDARNGEETLKQVIDNIELEAEVSVREGGA